MGRVATPITDCLLWVRHLAKHLKDLISSQLHNHAKVAYLIPNLRMTIWRLRGDRQFPKAAQLSMRHLLYD